jgi:hypothetical protein
MGLIGSGRVAAAVLGGCTVDRSADRAAPIATVAIACAEALGLPPALRLA